MNRKDYESYYQKLDLVNIIKVLENPSAYNSLVIEIAEEEIKSRGITKEEYDQIKLNLNRRKLDSQSKNRNINNIKHKVKSDMSEVADKAIDAVNPISINSPNTTIKLIASYFLFSGIYTMISQFSYLIFVFQNEDSVFAPLDIYTVSTFTLSIISGPFLWKLKKVGWALCILNCTLGIVASIYAICIFKYIDNHMSILVSTLFYSSLMYLLISTKQRKLFDIHDDYMLKIFMILVGVIILGNFIMLFIV